MPVGKAYLDSWKVLRLKEADLTALHLVLSVGLALDWAAFQPLLNEAGLDLSKFT